MPDVVRVPHRDHAWHRSDGRDGPGFMQRVANKTIVLTGAMIPYTFGSSDGLLNLGSALAFVQTLQSSVYLAMNASCFSAARVLRNTETGIFQDV